jgi:L-alanine-DL-glutamate epimerase-like enolase superfamily enzyme
LRSSGDRELILKIKDVRVSVHRVETVLPIIDRPGPLETRVVCEIETDNGYVGVGMTARFLCHAVAEAVRRDIAPALKDMDPRDLEAIHAKLGAIVSERGVTNGVNLMALSCVDLALWDIIGISSGRTVAELLGGFRDRAETYVTFGYLTYETDALVELGKCLMAKGHSQFKMLVGSREGLRADVARVRAVRDGLGSEVAIAIDANEGLSGYQATQLCSFLEDQDIAWIEDPVLKNDPRDLAAVRRRTSIPVAAGQMDGHGWRFREFIEHDALDIFMPNSMYNGGMTETMRVAHLSQIYNRPLSDAGGGGIYCLHHVAGFRNGTLAEWNICTEQVEQILFLETPRPEGGQLRVPSASGFGVRLNRDALKDTLVRN